MAEVRLISPITRQAESKLRVAAYCRVSSNSADQLNSYAAQIRVYKALIEKRPDWELADIFADEGQSGTKSQTRPEFQRMIRMCELKQIDLIITKSVSRFARNVKDALEYVRKLKLLGIGVQFEKEGIFTLALGDEMLLNTFSAIAQEESQSISQNLRLSIAKRMERGEYISTNAPYGYRLIDKRLVPYEPEAEIVKEIYSMYLNGLSSNEIARGLNERRIPTKCGKEEWQHNEIAYILKNERYMGDSLFQKTYNETTVPFKKHINRGEENQYYAKNTHSGIISRDMYDSVQALMESRYKSKTTTKTIYPLTSRIRCSECGCTYRRKAVKGGVKWACSAHISDCAACDSNYYSEERIYGGVIRMVNKLRFSDVDIIASALAKIETAMNITKKNNTAAKGISQEIAALNAKLLMLEQLRSKGYLAPDIYRAQANDIDFKLGKLRYTRQEQLVSRLAAAHSEITRLKALLTELDKPLRDFDERLFAETVKHIEINKQNEMHIETLGGLKFREII